MPILLLCDLDNLPAVLHHPCVPEVAMSVPALLFVAMVAFSSARPRYLVYNPPVYTWPEPPSFQKGPYNQDPRDNGFAGR